MAIGDLFKSQKEREREQQAKRRRAFREAERASDTVKDRITKLKKERDKAWTEARQYLKDGQKSAAQRCLQSCRASEVLMSKLEQKRWVFEQLLSKLEVAKSDQDLARALSAINTVVQIDPDAVADVLGAVEEKLGDQVDTDKIWEKVHEKEMEGAATHESETVPSLDQMMKDLQDEVAVEIEGEAPAKARQSTSKSAEEAGDTASLRQRARKIIDGGQG
jgi:translation elongation factor EF-1beta